MKIIQKLMDIVVYIIVGHIALIALIFIGMVIYHWCIPALIFTIVAGCVAWIIYRAMKREGFKF